MKRTAGVYTHETVAIRYGKLTVLPFHWHPYSPCPECEGKVVAKAVYGVIGVGVFITVKYCYPSIKKFFIKHFCVK
jgi:hypothetical protein